MREETLPEYVQRFLNERKLLTILVTPHAERPRPRQRPITSQQIHRIVLEGKLLLPKCQEFPDRPYDKYAVELYFADQNRTLKAILTVNWTTWFCQVETVWPSQGRPGKPRRSSQRSKKR